MGAGSEIAFALLGSGEWVLLPAWMLLQIILNASDKVGETEDGMRVDLRGGEGRVARK